MAKEATKTAEREERKPDEADKQEMKTTRTSAQEDDERKDRERLRNEHERITPERLSDLMTEKSKLKFDFEAEKKKRQDEFQHRIHELDIQIARGQPYNPGKTV